MSLPDGEYDIDLSGLFRAPRPESLAIRYGFVPESMDQKKPLVVYDDGQNLVLEAKDTADESIIFEGIAQATSKGAAALESCYLTLTGDKTVAVSALGSTIRVNRSRNVIKWKNMIAKWQSELESGSIKPREAPKEAPKEPQKEPPKEPDDDIIGESDFETLDNEFPVFELEDDLEKQLEAALESEPEPKPVKPVNSSSKPAPAKAPPPPPPASQPNRPPPASQSIASQSPAKVPPAAPKPVTKPVTKPAATKPAASRPPAPSPPKPTTKPAVKPAKPPPALRAPPRPRVSKPPPRKPRTAAKAPPKPPPSDDDDFKDLEDQLQELLGSSDESDAYEGGGVTIIDEPTKKTHYYNTSATSKPMSLREFMGDRKDDDDISEEE